MTQRPGRPERRRPRPRRENQHARFIEQPSQFREKKRQTDDPSDRGMRIKQGDLSMIVGGAAADPHRRTREHRRTEPRRTRIEERTSPTPHELGPGEHIQGGQVTLRREGRDCTLLLDGKTDQQLVNVGVETLRELNDNQRILRERGATPRIAHQHSKGRAWKTIRSMVERNFPLDTTGERMDAQITLSEVQSIGNFTSNHPDRGKADWRIQNAVAAWTAEQLTTSKPGPDQEPYLTGRVEVIIGEADEAPHPFVVYTSGDGKDRHVYDARSDNHGWLDDLDTDARAYYEYYIEQQAS